MQSAIEEKIGRVANRYQTEAEITHRAYTSQVGSARECDGVMRNFSSQGSYIETSEKYHSGTILIIRMVGYPVIDSLTDEEERPRSIGLAEVKWLQELPGHDQTRYGMGLKYLQ